MRFALTHDGDLVSVEDGTLYNLSALERDGADGLEDASLLPKHLWEVELREQANTLLESARGNPAFEAYVVPEDTPLQAPFPRPFRIFGIGRNYSEHVKELGNETPEEPIVFLKANTSVIGPDAAIEIPAGIGRVDFEGELAVVLGRGGKNIAEADAMRYVAGYTLFNDVTARDVQRGDQGRKHPWFRSKGLDTFGPMGPYFVTADEIADPHNLHLSLTVNGETKQNESTKMMVYSIPFLIAFLSKWFRLEAGDIIATGTPAGVGPIVPGDVVELTIPPLGTLRNPVRAAE